MSDTFAQNLSFENLSVQVSPNTYNLTNTQEPINK